MTKFATDYSAVLFRGWEVVRLNYAIDGSEVVVREKHTWSGATEKRVSISGLKGDTRRVWGRQKAHWACLLVFIAVGMTLGYNLLVREGGIQSGQIYWPLWGPGMAIGGMAWAVMWATRGRQEWTYFPPSNGGTGIYILKDRRFASAHQAFIKKLKQRIDD